MDGLRRTSSSLLREMTQDVKNCTSCEFSRRMSVLTSGGSRFVALVLRFRRVENSEPQVAGPFII